MNPEIRDYAFWASSSPPLSQDRDPSGYSFRSMCFSSDASILFTGGTDRRIRAWNLQNFSKSNIISQAATDQTEGFALERHHSCNTIFKVYELMLDIQNVN